MQTTNLLLSTYTSDATFALERPVHFLVEQRTRLYKRYYLGVAQTKNVLDAKKQAASHAPHESRLAVAGVA